MTTNWNDPEKELQALRKRVRELEQHLAEAQATLEQAEELNAIIQTLHDPVLVYDQQGVIRMANPSAVRAHGFDPVRHHRHETNQTLQARSLDGTMMHSEELPSARALQGEMVIDEPLTIKNTNGQELSILVTSSPLVVNGMQKGAVSVWRDITEQRRAEKATELALTQAEQGNLLLEALMDFLPEGICITGGPPDFLIQRVSRYGLQMTANPDASRVIGLPAGQHQYPLGFWAADGSTELSPEETPLYRAAHLGEITLSKEMTLRAENGAQIPISMLAAPIRNAQGEIVAAINSWRDFTEIKLLEERLRTARDEAIWLARFPDENPNPVLRVSDEGIVLYRNLPAASLRGWRCAVQEPLARPLLNFVELAVEQNQMVEQDVLLGDAFYSVTVVPILSQKYLNLYAKDITERKQAEKALAESERRQREIARLLELDQARLAAILRHLPVGVWMVNEQGRLINNNPAADRIWAGAAPSLDSLADFQKYISWQPSTKKILKPEEYPVALALQSGELVDPMELTIRRFDGSEGTVLASAAPIWDSGGQLMGVVGVNVDITERKLAEQALTESEERFHSLADSMPQLVWTALPDGTVDYYNSRYHEYWGIKQVQEAWEWAPVLHPDDLQPTLDAWQRALATGDVYQVEHRVGMADGSFRWHLSRGVPVYREDGRILRWYGTATDIHDLKLAEETLREYADRLEHSNRELEQFAFYASHDLQEPLRKIQVFGDLLLRRADSLSDCERDYVERMRGAAARMRDMVTGLLQLSRINTQKQQFTRLSLSDLVPAVLSDLEEQVKRTNGRVEYDSLPTVEGDRAQMHQLMQNLIGNALKYHLPGLPPHVKIHGVQTGDQVQIFVQDHGIGFEPEQAEHIFEPFKRLVEHSEYEGSGMGLTICRRIVERHGGKIEVVSQRGQGATFIVTLPLRPPQNGWNELRKDRSHE